jgi:hypothetical protein
MCYIFNKSSSVGPTPSKKPKLALDFEASSQDLQVTMIMIMAAALTL